MKRRLKWLGLLLLVPLAGAALQSYRHFVHKLPGPATSVFADAGFLTLRLTLDHHAPGSLYTVEGLSEGFVRLRPTCEVDVASLASAIQSRRTTDISSAIDRKLSAGVKIARKNWTKLGISADLTDAREIRAIYSDSRVELLSTEMIRALRDSFLSREACFDAVKYELEQGYEVCQTEAVIVSDLVYQVSTAASSTFGLETLIETLSSLGGSSEASDSGLSTVRGDKMYHAVKLHRSRRSESCILLNAKTAPDGGTNSGRAVPAGDDREAAAGDLG